MMKPVWCNWDLKLPLSVRPLLLKTGLRMLGAQAIPPPPDSFDGETIHCQIAGTAVTVLICRDAELTALDGLRGRSA
jgi:hypothetical protein